MNRVGRDSVRGVARQVELGRGECEQDLAWDRPAALGIAASNIREFLFAGIGRAALYQGQGRSSRPGSAALLLRRCDWLGGSGRAEPQEQG